MTASGVPVVTLTASKRRKRFGWRCTCRRYETGFAGWPAAMMSAEGHCVVMHPTGSRIDLGAASETAGAA